MEKECNSALLKSLIADIDGTIDAQVEKLKDTVHCALLRAISNSHGR